MCDFAKLIYVNHVPKFLIKLKFTNQLLYNKNISDITHVYTFLTGFPFLCIDKLKTFSVDLNST
jgi:hypothetical protein